MTLWVALVILVGFSAFFSASETAFSSLNQIRLKSRAEDGDSSAARVLNMAEQYDKLLSTILIGNNIVNIAAASIGTILFTRMLGAERGATVSTIVLTIIVLIFGEVTPKSLAKEMPEKVATAVSPFLVLLMALMTPLTWLFTQWKRLLGHFIHSTEEDTITEGELMTMVSEAENDGELTDRESQLIRSAIEFDDVEVEGVKTARAVFDGYTDKKDADFIEERRVRTAETRQDTRSAILNVLSESRLGSMPSNELRAAVLREIGCSDSTYNRVYSELVKSGEIAKHQINQGGNVRSWFTAMPYRGETSDKVAKL